MKLSKSAKNNLKAVRLCVGGVIVIYFVFELIKVAYKGVTVYVDFPSSEVSAPPRNVTPFKFERIHEGMLYEDVEQIIGFPGEAKTKMSVEGKSPTYIFVWIGDDGSGMSASFQDGRVRTKKLYDL